MNDALANRWRGLALAAMAALLLVIVALRLSTGPTGENIAIALVLSLPIFAPLIGVWRKNRFTYRWATLCVAPYLIVGIVEAVANPAARSWAASMLAAALIWFVSLVAFLRVTARH